jgi:hypothetical protein
MCRRQCKEPALQTVEVFLVVFKVIRATTRATGGSWREKRE